jgi:hypothetical protein
MNKKIRNATPLTVDGINFRSKLEAFTYNKLIEIGIMPKYEEEKYILIPAFTFRNEKIRPMTYTPDFTFFDKQNNFHIIECKGFANDVFPFKWKLFKYELYKQFNDNYNLHIVKNQREVQALIDKLR